MSRYIKFDDAVKVMACEMYAEAQSQGYDADGIEDFMPEATAWLNDAPSIDIVRCKACKHAHMTYGGDCKYCDMWKDDDDFCIELYLDGDFYCSYGEREGE